MATPRVSVVTVTYEAATFLPAFLDAVAAFPPATTELIVVDNASRDGSADLVARRLPEATLVRASGNLGFAGGSNLGARRARGEILFFLNPDTVPPADAATRLADVLGAHPDVGAAGSKLVFPDGRIQSAGGRLGPNAVPEQRGWGEIDRGQYDREEDVDYVPGAALAVRAALFHELGAFHEGYFPGFYEDTELCLRIRRRGLRVVYRPVPAIVHLGSATMGRREHYWLARNRCLFLARNRHLLDAPFSPVRELAWLVRTHVRPVLAGLVRGRPATAGAARQLAGVAAGEVAGVMAAVAELARRRALSAR